MMSSGCEWWEIMILQVNYLIILVLIQETVLYICLSCSKLDLTIVVLAVRFQSNTVGIVIIAHVL